MGGMGQDLCFVCSGALVYGESNWRSIKTDAALLENNLDVIFLLRNLVQVPSIQLECQLKESGDNPEDWISLCDQCTQLIKKGRELDEEIQKIQKQLRSIRNQVVGKITAGNLGTTDDKHKRYVEADLRNSRGDFQNKIRSFVKNQGSNQLEKNEVDADGLLEGDKLAKYLESQGNLGTAAIVLVEKPGDDDERDEIKVEQESPPSSPAEGHAPDDFSEEDDSSTGPDENEGKTTTEEMDNWSCSVCGRKLNNKAGLQRHVRLSHEKRFHETCPLCKMGFESTRLLHRHLFGKHKDDPVTKKLQEETGLFFRKCSVVGCGFHFMKQVDQDRHMERMHGKGDKKKEARFKCKYCGLGFWDGGKCRRHEKLHETKGNVRRRTGKGVTKITKESSNYNFKCDECGKRFKWARNWSDHLRNKHNQRDIICPGRECEKGFDNLVEFRKHWKTSHVTGKSKKYGEKHLCSFCGKEFTRQAGLLNHQKSQHWTKPGGEKLICDVEKKNDNHKKKRKRVEDLFVEFVEV